MYKKHEAEARKFVLHEDVKADELENDLSDSGSDQDADRPECMNDAMPVFDNFFNILRFPFIKD